MNGKNEENEKEDAIGSGLSPCVSFGLIFGIMIDNIALGVALGPVLGMALGAAHGKKEKERVCEK
ncbi:MAG: hypothetical protein AB9861_04550 [Methanosarcina sp.]|jgi:hypothetical protein